MTPAYAAKLGLTTQKTSIGAKKIDGSPLKTYDILSAKFLLLNSLKKVQFFGKTFLLADISRKIVLKILFLSLNNVDVKFTELEKLTWRLYTITKALVTTSQFELIDKREFARVVLNENSKTLIVHVSVLEIKTIYLF